MSKRYDIKSPRERKDGKTFWLKVGTMFEGDKGDFTIYLDALPLPDKDGRVTLKGWEPQQKQEGRQQAEQQGASQDYSLDDDIPF